MKRGYIRILLTISNIFCKTSIAGWLMLGLNRVSIWQIFTAQWAQDFKRYQTYINQIVKLICVDTPIWKCDWYWFDIIHITTSLKYHFDIIFWYTSTSSYDMSKWYFNDVVIYQIDINQQTMKSLSIFYLDVLRIKYKDHKCHNWLRPTF